MSRENVEIVHDAFRCFNARDWEGFERLYHPAASGIGPQGWPEEHAHGRDEVVGQFRRLREEGVASEADLEETDVHGEFVVARFRWRMTGSTSGLSGEHTFSATYRIEDGLIVEVRFYWRHSEALEAVGLSE